LTIEPGNIYSVTVSARDKNGTVLSVSPLTRLWAPWEHRKSGPPETPETRDAHDAHDGGTPIYHGIWWRTGINGKGLRPRIDEFLQKSKTAYEYEYVEFGDAWLHWRDGDPKTARKKFAALVKKLPKKNVVRATAQMFIDTLDNGGACIKRLNFQAYSDD